MSGRRPCDSKEKEEAEAAKAKAAKAAAAVASEGAENNEHDAGAPVGRCADYIRLTHEIETHLVSNIEPNN